MKYGTEMVIGATCLTIVGGFMGGLAWNGKLVPEEGSEAGYVQNDSHNGYKLLVFEQSGCGWCVRFRKEMGPWYVRTEHQSKAQLTYVHINRQGRYKLKRKVPSTPTVVLVDPEGYELSRMIGYPGGQKQLGRMVERHFGS